MQTSSDDSIKKVVKTILTSWHCILTAPLLPLRMRKEAFFSD